MPQVKCDTLGRGVADPPSTPLLLDPEHDLPGSQAMKGKKAWVVAVHSVSCSNRKAPSMMAI